MAKGVPILGKDPLGKAKYANVTESGDLRVQLSGTIIKPFILFNALAITDTAREISPIIDVRDVKNLRFYIRNTLNADLKVGVHVNPISQTNPDALLVYFEDGWKTTYHTSSVITVTDRLGSIVDLGSLYTFLNNLRVSSLLMTLTALTVPTSGSVSAWVVGERR
jgi:hypothetical protein